MSIKLNKKVIATSHHGNQYEGKVTAIESTSKGLWIVVACNDGKPRRFRESQLQLA